MAVTKIATSQKLPFYTEVVDLDGENFILTFKWNARDSSWHLSMYQADATPIAVGMRLCVGWNPFRRLVSADIPLGAIYVHDTTSTDVEPNFDDLGTRVLVLYVDSDEFDTLNAEIDAANA